MRFSLRYRIDWIERIPVRYRAPWIVAISDERVPAVHHDEHWKFGWGGVNVWILDNHSPADTVVATNRQTVTTSGNLLLCLLSQTCLADAQAIQQYTPKTQPCIQPMQQTRVGE